jgi:O-glycosyl hydrolase
MQILPRAAAPRRLARVLVLGLAEPCVVALLLLGAVLPLAAQTVTVDLSPAGRRQVIDGFGTCLSGAQPTEAWWQNLYLDTLGASILRVDLVPRFKSPWSDLHYHSPWFLGTGRAPYAFNFEVNSSHQPRHYTGPANQEFQTQGGVTYYNGPEGNRARTYTGPNDYGRLFGGLRAPIAVMGPDIDDNIARTLDLESDMTRAAEAVLAAARLRDPELARFKLVGSVWSPAPWLKVSSGTVTGADYGAWPHSRPGTPRPHVSTAGNFVGGRLDVSNVPLQVFDDSALPADRPGGPNAGAVRGPTSALVQFARSTAAYVRAFQLRVGARFYAISIQNELNFETFYHSCTYPLAEQYIAALKAVRAEFDKYDDLRAIRIKGPEDLLQGADYALWQFGAGATVTHKNLRYLAALAEDPVAAAAVDFFCIHGYAADGASSSGADPVAWRRWAEGWSTSPANGLPASVQGFTAFGKKSWMTETSGEAAAWLSPANGFPADGAWSIALKVHQALVAGRQSAWLYWQFSTGANASTHTLTGSNPRAEAPKLTALRHYAAHVRPGAVRAEAEVGGDHASDLLASAYVHEIDGTFVLVVLNRAGTARTASFTPPAGYGAFSAWRSENTRLWRSLTPSADAQGRLALTLPGYSVLTLRATRTAPAAVSYRAWRDARFTLAERDRGLGCPLAVSSVDGLTNLQKFALGSSPTSGPRLARSPEGGLVFAFARAQPPEVVRYAVEAAPDLAGPWQTVATDPGAPGSEVQVGLALPVPLSGPSARFGRLRLSLAAPL